MAMKFQSVAQTLLAYSDENQSYALYNRYRSLSRIDEDTPADDEGARLCCQEEKVPQEIDREWHVVRLTSRRF